jgi:hypothetical protein
LGTADSPSGPAQLTPCSPPQRTLVPLSANKLSTFVDFFKPLPFPTHDWILPAAFKSEATEALQNFISSNLHAPYPSSPKQLQESSNVHDMLMQSYSNLPVETQNESDDWESVEDVPVEEEKDSDSKSDSKSSKSSEYYDEESDPTYTMPTQPLPVMSKPQPVHLSSGSSSSHGDFDEDANYTPLPSLPLDD